VNAGAMIAGFCAVMLEVAADVVSVTDPPAFGAAHDRLAGASRHQRFAGFIDDAAGEQADCDAAYLALAAYTNPR